MNQQRSYDFDDWCFESIMFFRIWVSLAFVIFLSIGTGFGQETIRILALRDERTGEMANRMSRAVAIAEGALQRKVLLELDELHIDKTEKNELYNALCSKVEKGVSVIIDITWTGWYKAKKLCLLSGIPFIRADITIKSFIKALDDFIIASNGSDAALIFENPEDLNSALHYLIVNSIVRVVATDHLSDDVLRGIYEMRPTPSYFAITAKTNNLIEMFEKSINAHIVRRHGRWNLVSTDFNHRLFPSNASVAYNLFKLSNIFCCRAIDEPDTCECSGDIDIMDSFFKHFGKLLGHIFLEISSVLNPKTVKCEKVAAPTADNSSRVNLESALEQYLSKSRILGYKKLDRVVYLKIMLDIAVVNGTQMKKLATWDTETGLRVIPGRKLKKFRRFFRIGILSNIEPWSWLVFNSTSQRLELRGFCVELAKQLAKDLEFDFEFIIPKNGRFGSRMANGKWNGLVGDLAKGETDIVIAPLMMSSQREEIIDFVAPYFDESGISIMIRKPVRPTNMFEFMTVLNHEVWIALVGAVFLAAIMTWLLDKYSPYSDREITLKESFWYAMVAFTPQGSGEVSKALSGRIFSASYWLFVVLILTTFTANLAAFLTVERMKFPVESLEELARQSKIRYTIIKNGDAHSFFKNMKRAEDTIFTIWKETALNATSEKDQYKTWDYPLKEIYGHALQAIEKTGMVANVKEGIQKVLESELAEFAFIHDSTSIKYEISRNCNLTEIGEPFALRPYAIAVQQGSQLQQEISRKILELQKDRYFESQKAKFWDSHNAGKCPNSDDSQGITLGRLGGVFIITFFGLLLSMTTMVGEIFLHKRDQKIEDQDRKINQKNRNVRVRKGKITIGEHDYFRPNQSDMGKMMKISYISVYPKRTRVLD